MPVVYLDIPDIEKEKELNIRLNKNVGEWDFDLLKKFNFDSLLEFGFDEKGLSFWDEYLDVKEDGFNEEKKLKAVTETRVKLGDIILLGNHKLICGDSTVGKPLPQAVSSIDEFLSLIAKSKASEYTFRYLSVCRAFADMCKISAGVNCFFINIFMS